jgi:hypothetical protein
VNQSTADYADEDRITRMAAIVVHPVRERGPARSAITAASASTDAARRG